MRLLDQTAGHTLAPPTARDHVEPSPPPALAEAHKFGDGGTITFATPAPQSVIDLLLVYTDGMVTRFGSEAGVLARPTTWSRRPTPVTLNSEVAITLRLVATHRSSYLRRRPTAGTGSHHAVDPVVRARGRNTARADGRRPLRDSELYGHRGAGAAVPP